MRKYPTKLVKRTRTSGVRRIKQRTNGRVEIHCAHHLSNRAKLFR